MLVREIIVFKHYFLEFYNKQELKIQQKIEYVLDLVRYEENIPSKFFKYIENSAGIYEFRVVKEIRNAERLKKEYLSVPVLSSQKK